MSERTGARGKEQRIGRRVTTDTGTTRRRVATRSGKQYTYWEARFMAGYDPGTGRQVQRNITGRAWKEVIQRPRTATATIGQGTYTILCRLAVGERLDTWATDYLGGVKPTVVKMYKNNSQRRIKPVLGAIILSELRPRMVQRFIDRMELPSSSARLTHKVLHQALEKTVKLGYISRNPTAGYEPLRLEQKEAHPLEDQQMATLLWVAKGDRLELLVSTALFAGLRQLELLGPAWGCVDFQEGTLLANRQLFCILHREESGLFLSSKSGKSRTIISAPLVFRALGEQRRRRAEIQLRAGSLWNSTHNLVFTSRTGGPLEQWRIEKGYQATVETVGLAGTCFHDLRCAYAVDVIRAGDDIKTIQGNLGHASTTFALDRYGHFTKRMRQDSATHIEGSVKGVLGL